MVWPWLKENAQSYQLVEIQGPTLQQITCQLYIMFLTRAHILGEDIRGHISVSGMGAENMGFEAIQRTNDGLVQEV